MIESLTRLMIIVCGLLSGLLVMANFIAASIYDIRAARQKQRYGGQPYARRYCRRPLVTVVVVAQNHQQSITNCLNSLRRGGYRKLEIIVVDNNSTDNTKQRIKDYQAAYPKSRIRLIAKRRPAAIPLSARQAYKTYGHGQLLMVLGANQYLGKYSVPLMVRQFNDRPNLDLLLPQRLTIVDYKLASLFGRYHDLFQSNWRKMTALTHAMTYFEITGAMGQAELMLSILKHSTGLAAPLTTTLTYDFLNDAIVHQANSSGWLIFWRNFQTFRLASRSIRYLRPRQQVTARLAQLLAILAPLSLTYCIYLAVALHEPAMLMACLSGMLIVALMAIWSDLQSKVYQKLLYVFGLPVTLLMFLALVAMQSLSIISSLPLKLKISTRTP